MSFVNQFYDCYFLYLNLKQKFHSSTGQCTTNICTPAYSYSDLQQDGFQHHGELLHLPQCPRSVHHHFTLIRMAQMKFITAVWRDELEYERKNDRKTRGFEAKGSSLYHIHLCVADIWHTR